ncbi:MAG: hypothetical protein U5R48_12425 [Gammaproteobacteria bacterium]|nr:hypothetical protein [Gammaproteobacteria bacterium]
MHPVDSNEAAFKAASFNVFRNAFKDANPALLEPIHEVAVITPESHTGDVIGDLNTRRARFRASEMEGIFQKITAQVPEAELYHYSTTLRSITQGAASTRPRFSHYEQMPRACAGSQWFVRPQPWRARNPGAASGATTCLQAGRSVQCGPREVFWRRSQPPAGS